MADAMRVTLEIGPNAKRVVAVAPDWPGLERGAKTEEVAIERLPSYRPRYTEVAKLAGMDAEFAAITTADVVERYLGTGSTDFWGISFAFSGIDRQETSSDELGRELTLMRACWAFFDDVRSRVSAELQRGPRGGGRDRDQIVRHTLATEQDWAKKLGVLTPQGAMLTDEGLHAHRDAYCSAIRAFHAQGKMARTWPLPFLIRHTAYHTLDHAWEMEDKDLTARTRAYEPCRLDVDTRPPPWPRDSSRRRARRRNVHRAPQPRRGYVISARGFSPGRPGNQPL